MKLNLLEQLLTIFKWPMSLMASFTIQIFTIFHNHKTIVPLCTSNYFNSYTKRFKYIFQLLLILKLTITISAQAQSSSYRLIGSSSSYAQYLPWYPCLNGSLIFEFKTHEPNGLLVYTQSLPYKYIQLSLADGNLRLRMRIGEKDNPRGVFLVYQKSKLNDEKWHEIRITRMNERTILTIDNDESLFHVHKDANLEGNDLYFGDFNANNENGFISNNLLVLGGVPNEIQTYDLSLGTALFEHRFNGYIRNARVSNCTTSLIKLNAISHNNLRFIAEMDSCVTSPCVNAGICLIVSDLSDNYRCDCSLTNFEGKNCEKLKAPKSNQELTFTGKEYFSFQIPTGSSFATTFEEEFNFDFKTSRSTGLLLYAGDAQDYFVIGLQDGGIYFKINIKGQSSEKTLTIPGTFLHNNHWHSIKFARKAKKVI